LLSGCLTSARRILALASVWARDWVTRDMLARATFGLTQRRWSAAFPR
jgi:hypothetical protein